MLRGLSRLVSRLSAGGRCYRGTPVLTLSDVLSPTTPLDNEAAPYLAFYSSILGGLVRDPRLMAVPVDDHFVHRGHAVFDTALVRHGSVYQLDQHVDRLIRSAQRGRLKRIILDTIQCAGKRDQHIRYWLGAGPGGFGISHQECRQPSFYVLSIPYNCAGKGGHRELEMEKYEQGVRVVTTSVPMKPVPFSNIKTTNYLPNAMTVIEAAHRGAYMGVWVNPEGYIAECATTNLGFMIEGVFTVPAFDQTLAGISVQRMMHLVKTQLKLEVRQRHISISEGLPRLLDTPADTPIGKAAAEAFLFGGSLGALPVTHWDNQPIGSGSVGPFAKSLLKLYREDVLHGHGDSDQLIALKSLL